MPLFLSIDCSGQSAGPQLGQSEHHQGPGKIPSPGSEVVYPPGQGCHRVSRSLVAPQWMLSTADVLRSVARNVWFTSVDLKEAYFHVPIAPHHRQFLLQRLPLAVQGVPIQSLPLTTCVHQMCVGGPCTPAISGHEGVAIPG